MEVLILLIPFFTCAVLFIYFREKVHLLEYIITIILSVGIFFGVRWAVVFTGSRSTEYLGYYVTALHHYERWNEWIEQTCTKEVEAGEDSEGNPIYKTETYDCSYVREHPPYWEWSLNNGDRERISSDEYYKVLHQWTSTPTFIDMKRNYHTINGNCWYTSWDKIIDNAKCITKSNGYVNPIKGSSSTYKSQKISKKEAQSLDLYDYPKIVEKEQNPILAKHSISENVIKKWKFFNASYGHTHEIRTYLLFYYDKDLEISNKQAAYWNGGNKNELLIHVGLDSITNTVQWCNVTSWSDAPHLEVNIRNYIIESHSNTLDLILLADYIENHMDLWKRKEFSDFKYLKYEFSMLEILCLTSVMIIMSVGLSIIVVRNKYDLYYNNKKSICNQVLNR